MSVNAWRAKSPSEQGLLKIERQVVIIGLAAAAAAGVNLARTSDARAAGLDLKPFGGEKLAGCSPADQLITGIDLLGPGLALRFIDSYSGPKSVLAAWEIIDRVVKIDTPSLEIKAAAKILGVKKDVPGGISGLSKVVLEKEKAGGVSPRVALVHLLERAMHIYRNDKGEPVYIHFPQPEKMEKTKITEGQVCQILKPKNVIDSFRIALKGGPWIVSSPPPAETPVVAAPESPIAITTDEPPPYIVGIETPTAVVGAETAVIPGSSATPEIGRPTGPAGAPTVEQQLFGRGGEIPEGVQKAIDFFENVVKRGGGEKRGTIGSCWNGATGDGLRIRPVIENSRGQYLWWSVDGVFQEYPTGIFKNEKQLYYFDPNQELTPVQGSEGAVCVYGGRAVLPDGTITDFGEKPTLVKGEITLTDGRQAYLEYFDFQTKEWKLNHNVLSALLPDGNQNSSVWQDEEGLWWAGQAGTDQAQFKFDSPVNKWVDVPPPLSPEQIAQMTNEEKLSAAPQITAAPESVISAFLPEGAKSKDVVWGEKSLVFWGEVVSYKGKINGQDITVYFDLENNRWVKKYANFEELQSLLSGQPPDVMVLNDRLVRAELQYDNDWIAQPQVATADGKEIFRDEDGYPEAVYDTVNAKWLTPEQADVVYTLEKWKKVISGSFFGMDKKTWELSVVFDYIITDQSQIEALPPDAEIVILRPSGEVVVWENLMTVTEEAKRGAIVLNAGGFPVNSFILIAANQAFAAGNKDVFVRYEFNPDSFGFSQMSIKRDILTITLDDGTIVSPVLRMPEVFEIRYLGQEYRTLEEAGIVIPTDSINWIDKIIKKGYAVIRVKSNFDH